MTVLDEHIKPFLDICLEIESKIVHIDLDKRWTLHKFLFDSIERIGRSILDFDKNCEKDFPNDVDSQALYYLIQKINREIIMLKNWADEIFATKH